jgi:alpha-tubulin suppressor-like RCC1 family protein
MDAGSSATVNTERIGDDELPSSVGPVSVTETPGVTPVGVAAGDFHTCALLSDGSVKCWGSTLDGELGYGNKTRIGDNELPSSVGPVSVTATPGVTVTTLAAGFDHNCVLLSDGSAKCWGANVFAELGYGNLENIGDNELPSSVGPVSVTATPGVTVTAFTGGYGHTCALLSDRSVKCWGDNRFGQLGYGNTETLGDNELPPSVGPVAIY